MATGDTAQGLRGVAGTAKKITGWFIALAVLFIVLGIAAIAEPGVAGLAVTLLVGWALMIGGVMHLVTAFHGGGTSHVIWQVVIAVVYLIGGFYFLTHTFMAVGTLTLLLAGIFLAEGVVEIMKYFRTRSEGASWWLLLNGIVTVALGLMIWLHWPSSSVWAIGTIVGVNLLVTGVTRLMFGLAARKLIGHAAS